MSAGSAQHTLPFTPSGCRSTCCCPPHHFVQVNGGAMLAGMGIPTLDPSALEGKTPEELAAAAALQAGEAAEANAAVDAAAQHAQQAQHAQGA